MLIYRATANQLAFCAPIRIDASIIFYTLTHGVGCFHGVIILIDILSMPLLQLPPTPSASVTPVGAPLLRPLASVHQSRPRAQCDRHNGAQDEMEEIEGLPVGSRLEGWWRSRRLRGG